MFRHLIPKRFVSRPTARASSFNGRYPSSMDLGNSFYDKLFDENHLKERRESNIKKYPPQEAFMKMLPNMENAQKYQFDIYWNGVYGKLPNLPVDAELLTQKFINEADPDCVIWLMGRAGNKTTYQENQSDFENWKIVPRMLSGAHTVDSTIKFSLGTKNFSWPSPIAVAPVGVQGRVTYPNDSGDLVVSKAAASIDIPFIVSAVSSVSLEKIAEGMKEANPTSTAPWFQVYNSNVPELTKSMIGRAKKSGYGAIVLTLDTCKYGYRTEELDAAYFPQADLRVKWAQFIWDPVFNAILKEKFKCVASEEFSEGGKYPVDQFKTNLLVLSLFNCSLGDVWDKADGKMNRSNDNLDWFLDTVQKDFDMPLLLKGILHPEDAYRAVMKGVDGICVSNHGGRQVAGSISSIEALPGIISAVNAAAKEKGKEPIPVFLDSGIRYGQHVVKALALGATGVLVGRMPVIGACLGGEEGVKHVLLSLLADTQCTMLNAGYSSFNDLRTSKNAIVRAPHLSKSPFV